jgi:hypothetical protein
MKYRAAHRQRAYRKRLEQEAKAQGVSARLSKRTLQWSAGTHDRNGDAPTGRNGAQTRRGGLQASYWRALTNLTALPAAERGDEEIERALRAALSNRQRAELDRRALGLGR